MIAMTTQPTPEDTIMQDRNEYAMHTNRATRVRQHYAEANATRRRRVPTWVKLAVIAACIGLAGGLTGCGGGGSAVEIGPATAPAAQAHAAPTVLVLGDSTMAPYWPGEKAMPDYLPWPVKNIAVSGTTACQADLAAIRETRASVVAANYGLNDAYGAAGQPLHSLDAYASCLRAIDAAARDAGSVLVLLAANPTLPSPGWDADRIDAYNAVKRGIGAYYCEQPALSWSARYLPDGQHPSANAKPAIADALADCIKRAI